MFAAFAMGARAADARVIDLVIVGGRLAGEGASVRVTEGDRVTLRLTSDTEIEVHLHGYDIEATVVSGATTEMSFEAFATGRFPMTVHGDDHSEKTLTYLEVYPR